MRDKTISIGEAKRDIAELVKRVADGHERIVVTSRGKPKAVLVPLEDYQRLQAQDEDKMDWTEWLRRADELGERIQRERNGVPLDIESLIQADKEDLELRHNDSFKRKSPGD